MNSMQWTFVRSKLFRRIELQQLMNLTARALGQPARRIWTMPCDRALAAYAEYTRQHLQGDPSEQLLSRMGDEAYRMGRLLRRVFRLKKKEDIGRMLVELYRHIGIRLDGQVPGRLCFRACYFSQYYTPAVCLAASAMDEGIMRGLSGQDGHLHFHQRITEGCNHCIAIFE